MAGGAARVFLSHTAELRHHPRDGSYVDAAEKAVIRAGCVPTQMDYFTARDSQPAEYCQSVVAGSDVYVGIIGFRYGSPVRDRPDISYVELEFEVATQRGLPRLIFLLDPEAVSLPAVAINDDEHGPRQSAFRRRLMAGLTAAIVESPARLETRLYQALRELASAGDESPQAGNAGLIGIPVGVPLGGHPIEVRGREQLLGELVEARGLVVLAATGGMGKSTVAVELAERLPSERQRWWVSAADASSLTAGMVSVARRLGATEADLRVLAAQAGDAPQRFWELLEQAPERWLLVLDNADQTELLAARGQTVADGTGWVRASGRGLVVVTTRQTDQATWGRQARVERLAALSKVEAGRVLLDLAPDAGDQVQAEALGSRLGGLPLALHLAGNHLGATVTLLSSFASYVQALDREPTALSMLSPDRGARRAGDPRATVMQTWELSLDDLARHRLPHARVVLRLLSCYAPAVPIPIDLLESRALVALLGPASEEDASDEALRGLERLGLIDAVAGQGAVVVHRMIADASRAHLLIRDDPNGSLVWQAAVQIMEEAVEALDWRQPREWPRFRELTPHVRALVDFAARWRDVDHLEILLRASRVVVNANHMAGAILPAADLTEAALTHAAELGEDHPTILASHQHRAYQARERGQWPEAQRGFEDVFERRLRVLGPDHRDTLDSRFHLAWTRARQGQYESAEQEFREILERRVRVLGEDHPDVLATRHELARTITAQGRWEQADRLLRELLDTRTRVLGDDHPDTLMTRHYLARQLARRGRWEATVAGLEELLNQGPDDPAARPPRWAEAEAEFADVLEAQRRVLGHDHLDTLATRLQLARLAVSQGRWAEADTVLGEVLKAQRTRLDDDHPNVLETREYLAWTKGGQGRWEEAEAELRAVLDARRRVHGPDHPYALATRHLLASARADQRPSEAAEAELRELLTDRRRVLVAGHPDTLATHIALARTLARRDLREELEVASQALADAKRLIS